MRFLLYIQKIYLLLKAVKFNANINLYISHVFVENFSSTFRLIKQNLRKVDNSLLYMMFLIQIQFITFCFQKAIF